MNQMTRIVAAPAGVAKARFTAAEFLRMIEAEVFGDDKIELIEGEFYRMPPPGNDHSRRVIEVASALLGVVPKALVRAETGINLGDDTLVGCDAALLREAITGRGMLTPADLALVVEVAETTLSHDLGLKRRVYAEAGIPVYWVIDGARAVIHVHAEPVDGDYAEIHSVRFGQPIAVPGTDATITLD